MAFGRLRFNSWRQRGILLGVTLFTTVALQAEEPYYNVNYSSSRLSQDAYEGPVPSESELVAYEEESDTERKPVYHAPVAKASAPLNAKRVLPAEGEWQQPVIRNNRRQPARKRSNIQQAGHNEYSEYYQDELYVSGRRSHVQAQSTQQAVRPVVSESHSTHRHHQHHPQHKHAHQHRLPKPLTAAQKPFYPKRNRIRQVQHETVSKELQPLTTPPVGHVDEHGGKLVDSYIVDSYVVGENRARHSAHTKQFGCGSTSCNVCGVGSSSDSCSIYDNDCWCDGEHFRGRHVGSRLASDYAFGDFIEPITNPYWFIDPRAMTRVRLVTINQDIPETGFSNAGETSIRSFQGSIALGDRLSFMAVKGGRQKIEIEGQNDLDGWLDLALGGKWVFKRDVQKRTLLSGGVIYERTQGSSDVFQGNGHGMWNMYLSYGKGWKRSHWVSTVGWHLPNNHDQENESLFYSTHLDFEVTCNKFLVWELNGIHYTESGNFTPGTDVEGGDLFSLGADNVTGNDVITTAVGGVWRVRNSFDIAAAYEFPITGRRDFLQDRLTINFSYTY